ncbi:FAD-dependent oxidoreductase [Flavihumibacter sp. UBA7668]|uniref:FAD-dependent oxidoreductase n=1 Tax=Flavihumibacter sp. UBA7668 TaxID=1946542 RepID=UPI0025BDB9CE|nr:FAD-dependent oxidoreductase [Flavihumibacter sp. UBA7668]
MTQDIHLADIPVRYQPDVCIIGGGAAGVSAAIAAARCGLSVLLVERYGFCGGASVAGLSGTICGLFSSGTNRQQLVFGFADEFYQALIHRNGVTDPVPFGKTLLVPHDAFSWKCVADDLLLQHHCQVLYHTQFLRAFLTEEGRVSSLLLKAMDGFFLVYPRFVIDASGDAELVHSIGCATYYGKKGSIQTPTMMFKMGNVNMAAFTGVDPDSINRMIAESHQAGKYKLPRHHVYLFPLPHSGEVLCNMTKITFPDGRVPIGTNSADMSFAEMEGRRQAESYARFLIEHIDGFENAYLNDTGCQVGIRQSRSIEGVYKLSNEDVLLARKQGDAIALSAWPIELHGAERLEIHYLDNDYYTIPFETLVPIGATNYLVAGRCLSAEHEALASARVTAQCFGMGYAAGAAAALSVKEQLPVMNINGFAVNQWMKSNKLKTAYEQ